MPQFPQVGRRAGLIRCPAHLQRSLQPVCMMAQCRGIGVLHGLFNPGQFMGNVRSVIRLGARGVIGRSAVRRGRQVQRLQQARNLQRLDQDGVEAGPSAACRRPMRADRAITRRGACACARSCCASA